MLSTAPLTSRDGPNRSEMRTGVPNGRVPNGRWFSTLKRRHSAVGCSSCQSPSIRTPRDADDWTRSLEGATQEYSRVGLEESHRSLGHTGCNDVPIRRERNTSPPSGTLSAAVSDGRSRGIISHFDIETGQPRPHRSSMYEAAARILPSPLRGAEGGPSWARFGGGTLI
jgi:hypothetical protein